MKKALNLLLVLVMILSIITASGCAPAAKDETPYEPNLTVDAPVEEAPVEDVPSPVDDSPLTIVACSDFQNPSGNEAGAEFVKSVLTRISEDHPEVGGFLCSGDYDIDLTYNSPADTDEGIAALQSALHSVFGDDIHEAYCEGNHDAYDATLLSPSGNNDPENGKFGVFVINEDDYMWYSDSWNSQSHPNMTAKAIITETANNLKAYLEEKAQDGFTAPIFVISHLPLHYNMRTRLEGDAMYANYIFDVLNEAGRNGLNIVYLHGHNHSNGWDDYLGGSSVYLSKGDSINIAQESKKVFTVETLEFTYMNAGYTGYYNDPNGVGNTLTMTVFTITNDSIEISRYSKDGLHPLKNKGVPNLYKDEVDSEGVSIYPTDTTIVESPQIVELNKKITVPDWSVIGEKEVPPEVIVTESGIVDSEDISVVYKGQWRVYSEDDHYMSTNNCSWTAGSTAELTFVGTGIEVYSVAKSNYNGVYIYIDGEKIGDYYLVHANSKTPDTLVFSETDLDYGQHTIKVEVMDEIVTGVKDNSISIDYFKVFAEAVE